MNTDIEISEITIESTGVGIEPYLTPGAACGLGCAGAACGGACAGAACGGGAGGALCGGIC